MEYNSYLGSCDDDDVISFNSELCKFKKFKNAINSTLGAVADIIVEGLNSHGIKGANIYDSSMRHKINSEWLRKGKECEFLRVGAKGWQKGKLKIKITLEFFPDETEICEIESPLDDIRRRIDSNS